MPKRSYIKIYGPPLLKAVEALENLSLDMPEVCIMDTIIYGIPDYNQRFEEPDYVMNYFANVRSFEEIDIKRCDKLVSKSGEMLGEYDFYFEWFTEPSMDQVKMLIGKIDEALIPLGCSYTMTTMKQ